MKCLLLLAIIGLSNAFGTLDHHKPAPPPHRGTGRPPRLEDESRPHRGDTHPPRAEHDHSTPPPEEETTGGDEFGGRPSRIPRHSQWEGDSTQSYPPSPPMACFELFIQHIGTTSNPMKEVESSAETPEDCKEYIRKMRRHLTHRPRRTTPF